MEASFLTRILKPVGFAVVVLFGMLVVASQALEVATYGFSWQQAAQWALAGAVTYGVYRFYMHGRDTRSAYHERWEGLFEREPDAKPGENGP